MKYLGIDHGKRSGFGVVENNKFIACGHFILDSDIYSVRLTMMYENVKKLIEEYKPDAVCLEKPQDMTGATTSRQLIGYYCIAMLVAEQHELPIIEIHPMTLKRLITGRGKAEKITVCDYLVNRFNVPRELIEIPVYYKSQVAKYAGRIKDYVYDESDGTALAFCGGLI